MKPHKKLLELLLPAKKIKIKCTQVEPQTGLKLCVYDS